MRILRIGMVIMLLGATVAMAEPPVAKPLVTTKPVKVTSADAAGPIFAGKTAVKDDSTTDVLLLRSKDRKVDMGLSEAGPSEGDVDSYEVDEFMFFVAGGVKLTSTDGTVLEAQAGESVVIPKGWKGRWSTNGYKKYYVTYTGGAKPQ